MNAHEMPMSVVPYAVIVLACLIATLTDLWRFTIYNSLTLPVILSGLVYHGLHQGGVGVGSSLLGVLVGFLVLLLPYVLGRTGGGDVKLMMGIGAWLGVQPTFSIFVISSCAGGVYALIALVLRRLPQVHFIPQLAPVSQGGTATGEEHLTALIEQQDRWLRVIPYGAMIAVGVLVAPLVTSVIP